MKVTPKLLYRELRSALEPVMTGLGFKNEKDSRLGWSRPSGAGPVTVWFQADKWGWDDSWGSKFTVEFALAGRLPERIGYLLEGFEELDQLRIGNNEVIDALPGTTQGLLRVIALDDGSDFVATGCRRDEATAVYGRDIWLHYHSVEHVQKWGAYFAEHLPDFISLFESGRKSAQGQARRRFNEMMASVQGTSGIPGKHRILQTYLGQEPDQEFRAAAMQWQKTLEERAGAATPQA